MPSQTQPQLPATVAEALSVPIVADTEEEREHQLARIVERVAIIGDLALMQPTDRVLYYAYLCRSLGLNPLTRPFEFISLNGKLTLYPRRDTTDQLRVKRGVTIDRMERQHDAANDLAIVTAWGHTPDGRQDQAQGIVFIGGMRGETLANAWMKAETKAKRRLTLSLVGLGMLDETEVADTPTAVRVEVDPDDGTIKKIEAPDDGASRAEQVRSMIGAGATGGTSDNSPLEGEELERWLRGSHAAMRTRTSGDVHEQLRAVAASAVDLGDRSLNEMTRTEWRRTANAIASLPVIEHPDQAEAVSPAAAPGPASQPGQAATAEEDSAGREGRPAPATETPDPVEDSPGSATPTASPLPPGTEPSAAEPAADPATGAEQSEVGQSTSVSGSADPPPASPRRLLDALLDSPSQATFMAFALDVLGMEGEVTLDQLTEAELDQVISEATDDAAAWESLYRRLPAVCKAHIRAKKQHPKGRTEARQENPDAEQMRAALEAD